MGAVRSGEIVEALPLGQFRLQIDVALVNVRLLELSVGFLLVFEAIVRPTANRENSGDDLVKSCRIRPFRAFEEQHGLGRADISDP